MSTSSGQPDQPSIPQDGEKKPTPPAATKQDATKSAEPEKLSLTQAELDQRIADGIAAAAKKREAEEAEQKARDKEARDKEKGEFRALYEAEQKKSAESAALVATLKLERRQLQVQGQLRDYVAANAKDYLNSVIDIAPHVKVTADTTDEDAAKQIKTAVDEFVKRNPRGTGGTFDSKKPNPSTGVTQQTQTNNGHPRVTFDNVRSSF